MRLRDPRAFVVAAVILGASAAAADPTGTYVTVTPTAGYTLFDGSIRFPTHPLKDRPYLGARVGYQYLRWLGFEAAGGATFTREDTLGGSKVTFWHASGNVTLSAFQGLYGNPFISLGAGTSRLSPQDKSVALTSVGGTPAGNVTQGNFEAAAGWNYWVTDGLAVRVEGRDITWLPKHGWRHPVTHTITASAALTIAFGSRPRDTDLDGVPDRLDRCPGTPKGATVDATGCPHDSDGDGVLDGIDQCPNTGKGCRVDGRGCPSDADGDGVCDGIDQCPDTPHGAIVDSVGCTHDSDGDGVLDGIDQCPNTPKGCKVDAKGCPIDSDGDGVCDGIDQCPNTPAGIPVDSLGCPVGEHDREQELLDTGRLRLDNVFASGETTLRPDTRRTLDVIGDLLSHWPTLRIEVGGHADAREVRGRRSAALTQALSQARADTVRAYLLRRIPSLDPTQFVAKGYGASRPSASNETEAGRALNRRVEFEVLNRGVLIQEEQKRSHPSGSSLPETPGKPESPGTPKPPAPESPSLPTVPPAPPDTTHTPPH